MTHTPGKGKMARVKRSTAVCASCGARLQGVPNKSRMEIMRMPASKRAPNRPYGGCLCVRCTRETFRRKIGQAG